MTTCTRKSTPERHPLSTPQARMSSEQARDLQRNGAHAVIVTALHGGGLVRLACNCGHVHGERLSARHYGVEYRLGARVKGVLA